MLITIQETRGKKDALFTANDNITRQWKNFQPPHFKKSKDPAYKKKNKADQDQAFTHLLAPHRQRARPAGAILSVHKPGG